MDRKQEAQCGIKASFISEEAASEEANRLILQLDELIVPYSCPYCFQWHVGHATIKHSWQKNNKR